MRPRSVDCWQVKTYCIVSYFIPEYANFLLFIWILKNTQWIIFAERCKLRSSTNRSCGRIHGFHIILLVCLRNWDWRLGCMETDVPFNFRRSKKSNIWVRSRRCSCLVTWFCYQLIAKPGNKTAAVLWLDPFIPPTRWNWRGEYWFYPVYLSTHL